jgi:hypothetical protein
MHMPSVAMAWPRRRILSQQRCRRCDRPAEFEVTHPQFGVRVYCRDHFMRTLDVPAGAAVRWT